MVVRREGSARCGWVVKERKRESCPEGSLGGREIAALGCQRTLCRRPEIVAVERDLIILVSVVGGERVPKGGGKLYWRKRRTREEGVSVEEKSWWSEARELFSFARNKRDRKRITEGDGDTYLLL